MLALYHLGEDIPAAKTVEGEMRIIQQMVERLQAAGRGGWGKYPIVPQPVITAPEKRDLGSDLSVIVWPEDEYNRWESAWDYLAGTTLQRLGSQRKFPLGHRELAMKNFDLAIQDIGLPSR